MKIYAAFAALAITSACVSPQTITPTVSQYNGDSVSIQLDGNSLALMKQPDREVAYQNADAEAARICQKGHKKRAEYTSTRIIPTSQYSSVHERLYLCLG